MRIAAELVLPKTVRNDHLYAIRMILLAVVQASQVGPHSEHREEIIGYARAVHSAWLALPRPCVGPARQHIGHIFERMALIFVVFKLWHGGANSTCLTLLHRPYRKQPL